MEVFSRWDKILVVKFDFEKYFSSFLFFLFFKKKITFFLLLFFFLYCIVSLLFIYYSFRNECRILWSRNVEGIQIEFLFEINYLKYLIFFQTIWQGKSASELPITSKALISLSVNRRRMTLTRTRIPSDILVTATVYDTESLLQTNRFIAKQSTIAAGYAVMTLYIFLGKINFYLSTKIFLCYSNDFWINFISGILAVCLMEFFFLFWPNNPGKNNSGRASSLRVKFNLCIFILCFLRVVQILIDLNVRPPDYNIILSFSFYRVKEKKFFSFLKFLLFQFKIKNKRLDRFFILQRWWLNVGFGWASSRCQSTQRKWFFWKPTVSYFFWSTQLLKLLVWWLSWFTHQMRSQTVKRKSLRTIKVFMFPGMQVSDKK